MNSFIPYSLATYLSIALAICSPNLLLSAAPPEGNIARETPAASQIYTGQFESELSYTVIPLSCLKGGVWVTLTSPLSQDKENEIISLLTQHALFYGTKQYTRQDIAQQLNHLGMDIEADSYANFSESEQSLQFCLANNKPECVMDLLALVNQLAFEPILQEEQIELARTHLLNSMKETGSVEKLLQLQSLTTAEVQAFYSQYYQAKNMQLHIVSCNDPLKIIEDLPLIFGKSIKSESYPQQSFQSVEENFSASETLSLTLVNQVELASDNQTFVVDGKIWMKEPSWINKSGNGRAIGAILTILGIGGMILAFPIIAPVALIAGGLSTVTGIYFLSCDYIKDPYYLESIRQTDLKNGCAYAYKHHRAGITLTPYERRTLFLQEMIDHPHTLPKLPILLLADLYQLSDPVLAEIFTVDEFNVLIHLRRDFIQQRNQYKMLKENLENELNQLIAPYVYARDAALLNAKEIYNQNYYVISKEKMKISRDVSIENIKKSFEAKEISARERDAFIEEVYAYYNDYLSVPEFQAGLEAADLSLSQCELEIQATYTYQVEMCKYSIHYQERMASYQQGQQSLNHFYNNELTALLATFPVYLTVLPDYLDLRDL